MIILIIFIGLLIVFIALTFSGILFRIGEQVKDPDLARENGQDLLKGKYRVVAICAHPDDLEYWLGGTLGKLSANGSQVTAVICTKNQVEGDVREQEQKKAAQILGYYDVKFLNLPDRHLTENQDELKLKLTELFQAIKPQVVITFDTKKEGPVYHHPDHETAGRVTLEVSKKIKPEHIYFFHTSAPDTLVDISDIIDKKIAALDAHVSQSHVLFGFDFRDWQLRKMLSHFGKIINVQYVEPLRKGW